MNQGIGRDSYFKHWAIAMGLLLLTASLCAQLQMLYSESHLAVLVFIFITVLGLLFSTLFAWLQLETKKSYCSSWFFAGFLSLSLVLCSYLDHTVSIDWAAVSAGEMQLTLYQKIIRSDLTFWLLFLFPFVFSVMYFSVRSKVAKTKK
ncbi:hypothetical protein F909_00183 [Acinetobacter sp. ANC 3929]|uniref:hypothetical protein n=1 Tax=unclassified Acinetobacter TaxID=196816 RepID=UPI0002D10889|nr:MULTISPECIES: hypothetical protein [unclassified Acinetobacter]ENW84276.1 hypothetical protein F909_00183 [Acinetobacter sp. ANC 3929]MCH7352388.1 hypothetical protein [Acinetobacter sp. NIPH 2023]MCH7355873.1 hypothetical protein [Acinetobacter sp. NIPH 1958]MCH7359781.1 hypothetical protein [Acinetobacter sp. NIPH 2024]